METVLIILEQIFLYLPLICGAYLSFSLMRVPNFSFEGAFVFGALCAAPIIPLVKDFGSLAIFVVCCVAALGGAFVGVVMGFITTYGRVPYLLASIVTLGLCHGLHVYLMRGAIMPLPASINPLRVDFFVQHPELISLAVIGVVVAIGLVFFLRTQLGICLSVYGANPHFFAFHGINTTFVAMSGLMLTNALAGVSGYLVAQSSGFIDMNAGQGLSLFCVTALVMGNILLKKMSAFSSYIPFVGIAAYCILQQLLLHVGFNLKYFIAVQAFIVLVVVVSQRSGRDTNTIHSDHLGV